jgi:LPS export ABC transporter protein LptC
VNVVQPSSITFKREENRGFLIKLAACAAIACSSPPRDDVASAAKPAENQVLFEGVRIDRWEEDRLRYRARIRSVRLDRESGHVLGETVAADVLDRQGETEARVTAPRMTSDLRSRRVRLLDGVVITDRQRRTLRSETLDYDSAADRMETSEPVQIEGDNFRATGRRLFGQPREGHLEVDGPTTATVTPAGATSSRGAR